MSDPTDKEAKEPTPGKKDKKPSPGRKVKELPPGEEVKEHLKSRRTWLRFIYMVVFAFVIYVAKFVLLAIAVLQIVAALFTGEPNTRLTRFGGSLSQFIYQIALFLTYSSDEMPFPFADWPDAKRPPRNED